MKRLVTSPANHLLHMFNNILLSQYFTSLGVIYGNTLLFTYGAYNGVVIYEIETVLFIQNNRR